MLGRYTGGLAPYGLLVLRVVAGLVFLAHGVPKLGFFGGFAGFLESLGIPAPQVVAVIVVIAEIVGGAALIVGVATRWAALALTVEMIVTTLLVKLPNLGLVAAPDRPGVGAEIDLMLLAAMLVLLTAGPGALALDRAVLRREL